MREDAVQNRQLKDQEWEGQQPVQDACKEKSGPELPVLQVRDQEILVQSHLLQPDGLLLRNIHHREGVDQKAAQKKAEEVVAKQTGESASAAAVVQATPVDFAES